MKKLLSILLLVSVCLVANAVPAKRGQWQVLTLADGTKVQAELKGDEHSHYWMAADGRAFTLSSESDFAVLADRQVLEQQRQQRDNGEGEPTEEPPAVDLPSDADTS